MTSGVKSKIKERILRPVARRLLERYYRHIDILKAEVQRIFEEREAFGREVERLKARETSLETTQQEMRWEIELLGARIWQAHPEQEGPDSKASKEFDVLVASCLRALINVRAQAFERLDAGDLKDAHRQFSIACELGGYLPDQSDPAIQLDRFLLHLLGPLLDLTNRPTPGMAKLRPDGARIALSVVVWGDDFCQLMTDVLFGSLLAPGNVPALSARGQVVLYVVTTPAGRAQIEATANTVRLSEFAIVEFIEFPEALTHISFAFADARRYWLYGALQQITLLYAKHIGASIFLMNPDTVYSERALSELYGMVEEGKDCVTVTSHRLVRHEAVPRILEHQQADGAISLSAPDLSNIGVQFIHAAHKRCYLHPENQNFAQGSVNLFWEVPGAIVMHAAHQLPAVISHRALASDFALNYHTIDAGLLERLFPTERDWERVYVVPSLDRICYFEFTYEDRAHPPDAGPFELVSYSTDWFWQPCNDLNFHIFKQRITMPIEVQPRIGVRRPEDVDAEISEIIRVVAAARPDRPVSDLCPAGVPAVRPSLAPPYAPSRGESKPPLSMTGLSVSERRQLPGDIGRIDIAEATVWLASEKAQAIRDFIRQTSGVYGTRLEDRVLQYHVVRCLKPSLVLLAGEADQTLADVASLALSDNGHGVMRMLDLNSGGNSADEGLDLADVAFVEAGLNGRMTAAWLATAALRVRRAGVMAVNRAGSPEVFWAVKDFLRQSPGWTDMGGVISRDDRTRPFHMSRGIAPNTTVVMLEAPNRTIIGAAPTSLGETRSGMASIDGVRFSLPERGPRGWLHCLVVLRSFGRDEAEHEEYRATASVKINGGSDRVQAKLVPALRSKMHDRGEAAFNTSEVFVAWDAEDGAASPGLMLASEPELVGK